MQYNNISFQSNIFPVKFKWQFYYFISMIVVLKMEVQNNKTILLSNFSPLQIEHVNM